RLRLGWRQKRGNGRRRLAAVAAPQALDRLVAHRRPAVGVQELAREARAEVVLEGPHPGCEVVLRIPEAGEAQINERAEAPVLHEHVREAVIAVDENVARPGFAEGAVLDV